MTPHFDTSRSGGTTHTIKSVCGGHPEGGNRWALRKAGTKALIIRLWARCRRVENVFRFFTRSRDWICFYVLEHGSTVLWRWAQRRLVDAEGQGEGEESIKVALRLVGCIASARDAGRCACPTSRTFGVRERMRGYLMERALRRFTRWARCRIVAADRTQEREAILESRELHEHLIGAANLARIETENYNGDSSAKCPMRATDAPRQGKDTTE